MQINSLSGHPLAAEAVGVDTGAAGWETGVLAAFGDHPVLCLRGQALDADGYVAAMARLGHPKKQLHQQYRHPRRHEIMLLASDQVDVKGDGKKIVIGTAWHTDDSYMAEPSSVTILQAEVLPESGGDTEFADTRQAFDALPEKRRREIGELRVEHRYYSRRNVGKVAKRTAAEEQETPPVEHPLVRTHPVTGRKALYLNPNRMHRVVGLPLDEGDALLDELIAHATQPDFTYRHRWQPGDIVTWDNRCTMHRANHDYGDQPRRMNRILLAGDRPF
jgi:taurine dioxygenase